MKEFPSIVHNNSSKAFIQHKPNNSIELPNIWKKTNRNIHCFKPLEWNKPAPVYSISNQKYRTDERVKISLYRIEKTRTLTF